MILLYASTISMIQILSHILLEMATSQLGLPAVFFLSILLSVVADTLTAYSPIIGVSDMPLNHSSRLILKSSFFTSDIICN